MQYPDLLTYIPLGYLVLGNAHVKQNQLGITANS